MFYYEFIIVWNIIGDHRNLSGIHEHYQVAVVCWCCADFTARRVACYILHSVCCTSNIKLSCWFALLVKSKSRLWSPLWNQKSISTWLHTLWLVTSANWLQLAAIRIAISHLVSAAILCAWIPPEQFAQAIFLWKWDTQSSNKQPFPKLIHHGVAFVGRAQPVHYLKVSQPRDWLNSITAGKFSLLTALTGP